MSDGTVPTMKVSSEALPTPPVAPAGVRTARRVNWADRTIVATCWAVIAGSLLLALLAPVLAPYDPIEQRIIRRLRPPSTEHLMGTDQFGRDVLSRVIWGSRSTLTVAVAAVLVAGVAGTAVGILAGYRGRTIDRVISGVVDGMMAFPVTLLGLALLAVLGPGVDKLIVAGALALFPRFVRAARAPTLAVRELEFVQAARVMGADDLRIMARHILPSIRGGLMTAAVLWFALVVRIEAGLSFLGVGIQPPQPSWGLIIREGFEVLLNAPWLCAAPGIFLFLLLFSANTLTDRLHG